MKRPVCVIDGCDNLARIHRKNKRTGKVFYWKYCRRHFDELHGGYKTRKQKLLEVRPRDECSVCGWLGPCDHHRLNANGTYNKNNIVVLCPNCHRLVHRGLLEVD